MKNFIISRTIIHTVFLFVSIVVALLAKYYADQFQGPIIPDLVLDNIPYVNTDFFFYQGAFILIALVLLLLIRMPRYIPFTFAAIALLHLLL